MQKINLRVILGSKVPTDGLNPFVAMAGDPAIASATIVAADEDGEVTSLTVFKVDQGSNPLSGIQKTASGDYVMLAYESQFTQLLAVQKTVDDGTFSTSSEANLTAPNGDVAHFTFELVAQPEAA